MIRLTTNEAEFECSFEQGGPLAGGAAGASGAASGPPVVGADRSNATSTTSGNPPGRGPTPGCVTTSGSGSAANPPDLLLTDAVDIGFQGTTPTEVTLVLIRDEHDVHRDELRPNYTRVFPNGRECDEGCLQASEDVAVTTL